MTPPALLFTNFTNLGGSRIVSFQKSSSPEFFVALLASGLKDRAPGYLGWMRTGILDDKHRIATPFSE